MKKNETTNSKPRTVQQLMPWLSTELAILHKRLAQSSLENGDNLNAQHDATPLTPETIVHEIAGCFHKVVSLIESLLVEHRKPAFFEGVTMADFVRVLLLSGNGERFEPAVRSVIRAYSEIRHELFRYSRRPMPEKIRNDVLASFAKPASEQKQNLLMLGVELEEVSSGTTVDPSVHHVVKRLETKDASELDTIRWAITPIFRWRNGHEMKCIEHAQVAAYTKLKGDGDNSPSNVCPSDSPQSPLSAHARDDDKAASDG